MDYVDHVYVINMDKSKDRMKNMLVQETKIGKAITRIPAVVGKDLSKQELNTNATFLCKNFCSPSMIGCFLSHRKAWETMVRNGDNYSIIMEDDCKVVDSFQKDLSLALNELISKRIMFDFVYLGCFGDCYRNKHNFCFMDKIHTIFLPKIKQLKIKNKYTFVPNAPVGFHCYLLTNSYARKLLSVLPKANYHVDVSFVNISNNFKIFATNKNIGNQYATSENSTQTNNFPILLNKWLNQFLTDKGISYGYLMSTPLFSILGNDISLFSLLFIIIIISLILFKNIYVSFAFIFYFVIEIMVYIFRKLMLT